MFLMFDIIACSILAGFVLIVIYYLKNKEIPTVRNALLMVIYGQSLVYGMTFVLYGITANTIFFVENRWIIGLGGVALFWIGYECYRTDLYRK